MGNIQALLQPTGTGGESSEPLLHASEGAANSDGIPTSTLTTGSPPPPVTGANSAYTASSSSSPATGLSNSNDDNDDNDDDTTHERDPTSAEDINDGGIKEDNDNDDDDTTHERDSTSAEDYNKEEKREERKRGHEENKEENQEEDITAVGDDASAVNPNAHSPPLQDTSNVNILNSVIIPPTHEAQHVGTEGLVVIEERVGIEANCCWDFCPLSKRWALKKEAFAELLQNTSNLAVPALLTLNIYSASYFLNWADPKSVCILKDDTTFPGSVKIIAKHIVVALPFVIFPLTLYVSGQASALKRSLDGIGYVAGLVITEVIYVLVIGGLMSICMSNISYDIVSRVIFVLIIMTIVMWSQCCYHPKFLRTICFSCCRSVADDEDDLEAGRYNAQEVV